ncbi:proteasome maturation protein [Anoplophora glabripennis]|uniref:proteasome maturation protein n=1 Tax=Anoplophora glabripennis TaxID=217634 RepID=UPI000874FAD3|nr:proteasome maturation protein [Anoplophora glabripennis]
MSFALPSVKPKPSLPESFDIHEGSLGVPDLMTNGLASARCSVDASHPVALSELNYRKNVDKMNMTVLRNTQGLHAPLRITMELKSAQKIGRLPFLQSSNVMYDVLTGRDLEIGPEDIFNTPEFLEISGQPHAMVERSLGLL